MLALGIWVGVLAVEYYLHLRGVQRHHLESAWMWFVAGALLAAAASRVAIHRNPERDSWTAPRVLPVALVAFAVVLYLPAIGTGFLSDDFALSDLAARNQFFGLSWSFLRPLQGSPASG